MFFTLLPLTGCKKNTNKNLCTAKVCYNKLRCNEFSHINRRNCLSSFKYICISIPNLGFKSSQTCFSNHLYEAKTCIM